MTDDEQPDCGGNRHYDYISIEAHEAAEKTVDRKQKFEDLTTNEIVVLRSRAKELGIVKDIVDQSDRLPLVLCLLYWVDLFEQRFRRQSAAAASLRVFVNNPSAWQNGFDQQVSDAIDSALKSL